MVGKDFWVWMDKVLTRSRLKESGADEMDGGSARYLIFIFEKTSMNENSCPTLANVPLRSPLLSPVLSTCLLFRSTGSSSFGCSQPLSESMLGSLSPWCARSSGAGSLALPCHRPFQQESDPHLHRHRNQSHVVQRPEEPHFDKK